MHLTDPIISTVAPSEPQFRKAIHNLMSFPVSTGNDIATFNNGVEIFPAMLEAIRAARETITLETYIYWTGQIGREFAEALSERAAAGVKVHALIDAYGGMQLDDGVIDGMCRHGVQVYRYRPIRWYQVAKLRQINERSHRKILVVDGRIGFTGGVGIADNWLGNADSPEHWRDIHFRLKGPIVGSLQSVFMDHWMESSGRVLLTPEYFPDCQQAGPYDAQVVKSTAHVETNNIQALFLYTLASAREEVLLGTAYFVPDRLIRMAICDALKRGIKVRIIVPGPITDYRIVRTASRALWGEMLEAGVEIYEYMPTLYHCKVMIVDRSFVSIGSANLDNRSFSLNDECNVNVFNEAFADEQRQIMENDLNSCRKVTIDQWRKRPMKEKIREGGALIFQHQL